MLPNRKGRRNGDPRRATGTPIGSRNLLPREPVVLPPEDYDQRGGDFYDYEWEADPLTRSAVSIYLTEDDCDDLSEAAARARARGEQVRLPGIEARADQEVSPAVPSGSSGGESADDGHEQRRPFATASDAGCRTVAGGDTAEYEPLSPEEARHQAKRDRRIVNRLRDAEADRLARLKDPDALAGESAYAVVCHGAVVRYAAERAKDAYAELYHSPPVDPREVRQARLDVAKAVVARWKQTVARYTAWVAENRPELADEELLELLAGSKEDRTAAKARLAELELKYRTGRAKSGPAAPADATSPVPLIYRDEYRGKVRAYPEWVAPVLRQVAREHAHQIPAMAFVLAQLAYWTEPKDGTGRPRAKRAKVVNDKWWVVLGYGQIEKQTPVSKGQAKRAIRVLRKLKLVETLTAKDANVGSDAGGVDFGPNTVFLRVNTEVLDPLVRQVISGGSKSGFGK